MNTLEKRFSFILGILIKNGGVIEGVDDLGWTIKITDMEEDYSYKYKIGDRIFISHSKPFSFRFLED